MTKMGFKRGLQLDPHYDEIREPLIKPITVFTVRVSSDIRHYDIGINDELYVQITYIFQW